MHQYIHNTNSYINHIYTPKIFPDSKKKTISSSMNAVFENDMSIKKWSFFTSQPPFIHKINWDSNNMQKSFHFCMSHYSKQLNQVFIFFFQKIRSKKKNDYQINILLLDLLQTNARHLWTSLALTIACAVCESLSKTRKSITSPNGVGRVAD